MLLTALTLVLALIAQEPDLDGHWVSHYRVPLEYLTDAQVVQVDDLDGDLIPDFAIAPAQLPLDTLPPRVALVSGGDGSVIRMIGTRNLNTIAYGSEIVATDDFDGDGLRDLLVSNWRRSQVDLISSTGTLIRTLRDPKPRNTILFGDALAVIDDIDQDGVQDFLVGNPGRQNNWSGRVLAFSGASGSHIRTYELNMDVNDRLGASVAAVPDMDNDGLPDILTGAPGLDDYRGELIYFSSSTGAKLKSVTGREVYTPLKAHELGLHLDPIGDVDGDGHLDLAASSWDPLIPTFYSSQVPIIGSSRAELLYLVSGPTEVGLYGRASNIGDLDQDGIDDFVLTATTGADFNSDYGELRVHSGVNRTLLDRVTSSTSLDTYTDVAQSHDGDETRHIMMALVHEGASSSTMVQRLEFRPYLLESASTYSLSGPSSVEYKIDFPVEHAGSYYFLLATMSGIGATEYGVTIPLVQDKAFNYTANWRNPILTANGWQGVLDQDGNATAILPPNLGLTQNRLGRYHFAAIALPTLGEEATIASGPVLLWVTP